MIGSDDIPRDPRPRIGRPRKAEAEKRAERLPAPRVTAAELAHVQAQAARAGLDVAEFCRRAALRQRIAQARAAADDALLLELNRVGVNLNQIARRLNASGRLPPHLPEVLEEVRAVVTKVARGGA